MLGKITRKDELGRPKLASGRTAAMAFHIAAHGLAVFVRTKIPREQLFGTGAAEFDDAACEIIHRLCSEGGDRRLGVGRRGQSGFVRPVLPHRRRNRHQCSGYRKYKGSHYSASTPPPFPRMRLSGSIERDHV